MEACDFLAIPGTSVSVEQLFSKSCHLCSDVHSSMKAETTTQAMYAKVWLKDGFFEFHSHKLISHKIQSSEKSYLQANCHLWIAALTLVHLWNTALSLGLLPHQTTVTMKNGYGIMIQLSSANGFHPDYAPFIGTTGLFCVAHCPYAEPVEHHDLGQMEYVCAHCGALHWFQEKLSKSPKNAPEFGMCCKHGEVQLPPLQQPPEYLYRMYTAMTTRLRSSGRILHSTTQPWHLLLLESIDEKNQSLQL
ncbi:hypothetical protein D9758_017841 [Tetrapyrgos nigripes]|uniref:HAT C-terminal dimerisation domain-containing protein n=1 Tax=Tetrapyrgos nigripes TaxID=182062 RepID=A0A8H5BTG6_9AGAR|nr:hypothetical protein D9758_017841 [Tetrapyrgos nigripes]